jgi:chemotaxis protein CheD
MVRMGELAATAVPGEVLVSIGLGSCVGLVLVDARRSVVGLAHVMLPASTAAHGPEAKFADLAVERLAQRVRDTGARRMEAVLVGGAQMFALNGASNIGLRNEAAVRAELERLRIPIRAAATGGEKGRTVRVHVEGARVTVREVAGTEEHLYGRAA